VTHIPTSLGIAARHDEKAPTNLPTTHGGPLPTVDRSDARAGAENMPGTCEVHATSAPPKPPTPMWPHALPPSCCQDAADDDEQPEPCEPTKSRLDGTPERCREVWDEFCAKQDPSKFKMDEDLADAAASLAAVTFPPVARAALEEQLGLAPGSLIDGSVQVIRMRARRIDAEVVVLDPVQRRMRSAHVRLIGPGELDDLARVLGLLKSWEPANKTRRKGDP